MASQAEQLIGQVRDTEVQEAAAADVSAADQYRSQRTLSLVLLAVGLALALAIGWTVARGIARGVARVKAVTEALAAGDLTRSSGLTTRDELGQMAPGAGHRASTNLREVMAGVVALRGRGGGVVGGAVGVLGARSRRRRRRPRRSPVWSSAAAEEVSRNVQTVAAGAEQMGASIREIAQNANEAARVAAQAVDGGGDDDARRSPSWASRRAEIGDVVKVITIDRGADEPAGAERDDRGGAGR